MKTLLPFRVFTVMWSVFILIHHTISFSAWTRIGVGWLNPSNSFFLLCGVLTGVFAFWTVVSKGRTLAFFLTLAFWSLLKLDNLPHVPNHIILALVVNLMWLSVLTYQFLAGKVNPSKAYQTLVPYLKINLVIVYFFSVFHKLNQDYLNPAVSCAVDLYANIHSAYPFMPSGHLMDEAAIYSTLLIEASIPILLMSRRFWRVGVMLAIVFHTLLSLHTNVYIMSFSAEIFAMLTIFMPEESLARIVSVMKKRSRSLMGLITVRKILMPAAVFILIGLGLYLLGFFEIDSALKSLFHLSWFSWCAILFLVVARYGKAGRESRKGKVPAMPLLIIFPLLFTLNGFTPYLGLKTATNFSMFSNLWIKGKENNHLLIHHNYPLLDYSSDQVEIIESNEPYFARLARDHINITYFELLRWLDDHPDVGGLELEVQHHGEITDWTSLRGESFSWVEKKLLIYRLLPPRRPCPCQW